MIMKVLMYNIYYYLDGILKILLSELFILINISIFIPTGGWALVFAVEDVNTGKEYALKVSCLSMYIILKYLEEVILT